MKTAVKLNRSHLAQVNWKAVIFFYILACGLSYGLHFLPNLTEGILPIHEVFTYGLGPVLAALMTRFVFPNQHQTITVLGTSPIKTCLFVATPVLLSAIIGVHNRAGQNEHLFGLLAGVSGILYGFGEEMGWRGWLQDALRPLPTFWRVTLIGILHAGWHLTFLPNLSAVSGGQVNGLIVVGILILMAWGFGSLVDTTKSVLMVACAHECMTIAVHPVSLALTLLVWIWLTRNWRKHWVVRFGQKLGVGFFLFGCFVSGSVSAQSDSMAYTSLPKQEIIPGESQNFTIFNDDFYQNQLFLLGESHGIQKAQTLDFELLKHLNQKVGVRYYVAEVDNAQAYYLNQFLKTGDDATLMKVFRVWVDAKAQWANKDFIRKIQKIRALNQSLQQNRHIQFVGIDRIQDKTLTADYMAYLLQSKELPKLDRPLTDSLMKNLQRQAPDSTLAKLALAWLQHWQKTESVYQNQFGSTAGALRHLLANVSYLETIKSREKIIFQNFQTALPSLNGEKLYGFWGFFHVLQSPLMNGGKPFACLAKESGVKVVSITCSYLDCYSMIPTAFLPPFWQDKGKTYSRLAKFNNDSELMHTEGIEAMRAATRSNTMTLFALDRPGSFAHQMPIRIKYSPFMPQKIEFDPTRPMTNYFQYVVLIRDSDMTEPIVP